MPTPYAPGYFVWYDLMTTDREASAAFYTELFGWTKKEQDMGTDIGTYIMLNSGDDGLGGMVPLHPEQNIPSHWINYISVEDVDASCEEAKKLGGTVVVAPFDIPNTGRTAVLQDPTGAYFSLFSAADPYEMPDPRPGLIGWNELMSKDIQKANEFYTALIGWDMGSMDMGDQGIYYLYRREDKDQAGAMQMPPEMEAPSYWMPYVGVSDVPGTAAKAEKLGAKIFLPPKKVGDPVNVHFSILASPDGAMFGILEM